MLRKGSRNCKKIGRQLFVQKFYNLLTLKTTNIKNPVKKTVSLCEKFENRPIYFRKANWTNNPQKVIEIKPTEEPNKPINFKSV
jgi:hypothetical protein